MTGTTNAIRSVGDWRTRASARARGWASLLRRIIGAPDYEAYLAHQRTHHPECTPLSRRDFERSRLDDRYSRPGNRCC